MRKLIMVVLITTAFSFFSTSCSKKSESVDQADQSEKIQQLEKDVYLLGEKIYELEEQLKALQKSHELAVFVNQDLDERLSKVEGKSR